MVRIVTQFFKGKDSGQMPIHYKYGQKGIPCVFKFV